MGDPGTEDSDAPERNRGGGAFRKGFGFTLGAILAILTVVALLFVGCFAFIGSVLRDPEPRARPGSVAESDSQEVQSSPEVVLRICSSRPRDILDSECDRDLDGIADIDEFCPSGDSLAIDCDGDGTADAYERPNQVTACPTRLKDYRPVHDSMGCPWLWGD